MDTRTLWERIATPVQYGKKARLAGVAERNLDFLANMTTVFYRRKSAESADRGNLETQRARAPVLLVCILAALIHVVTVATGVRSAVQNLHTR